MEETLQTRFANRQFCYVIVITEQLIDAFAGLSGDYSDLHIHVDFARKKGFKDRVAHGNILGCGVSRLVGMQMGTADIMLVSQYIKYLKPCFPGDDIEIRATTSNISEAVALVEFDLAFVRKQDNVKVATGLLRVKIL